LKKKDINIGAEKSHLGPGLFPSLLRLCFGINIIIVLYARFISLSGHSVLGQSRTSLRLLISTCETQTPFSISNFHLFIDILTASIPSQLFTISHHIMIIPILTCNRFILIQNILLYNHKQIPFIKDYANNHNLTRLNRNESILDNNEKVQYDSSSRNSRSYSSISFVILAIFMA
jgi:hypothetical protein